MSDSKFVKANEKIAESVVEGYKKIEDGVVGGYKKIEKAFVDKYLTHEGESAEDAKKRMEAEQAAREEALDIKKTYEQNMLQATQQANEILVSAQKTAAERSEKIIGEAQQQAAQIKSKASADIAMEKKKAINDAKNEISGLAMAIASKVVERELGEEDQSGLIDRFIDELGDQV